ncbi:hypothetical protein [Flavobacterium sp. 245]|uniref:hypothetical protein n=1 Tax=Flavobacterium sp. 245 TaxID=2512115 RepID=UPI00105FBCE4|nr:hypothetical protein [Flavobacterium sp. 245]TDO97050.1 hypothetical protein EV145_11070 [Flavobacterium sp. 245]
MKHLIYFLLFSTAVFSQNYQYSLDQAPVKTPETPTGVNNQLEEIDYFKAYLLPIAQKATLQSALDKYGSVRLEKGDYSGVDIVMTSDKRLYGHPSLTKVSNITIAAGSKNVRLENLLPSDKIIKFESGAEISGCIFKSIKWATLQGTNVALRDNSFIDFGGPIRIDCSVSGYIRNTKIIKHQAGTVSNLLIMKGNSIDPSYGNVHVHTNFLTPHGDTTELDGLQSATFVGLDAEGWNLLNEGTKAMFSAKNMGNLKITDFGGGSYESNPTPSYDIDANNLSFYNKFLRTSTDVLSTKTNMFLVFGLGNYLRKSGTVTGFDLLGNLDGSNAVNYNGVEQTAAITNTSVFNTLSNTIQGPQYKAWDRANWETLPDPLGPNWKTERAGKPDQTSYIQNLINTNGIAELPEGIFYIGATLKLPIDSNHGIIGQGTGKTVIVGLTDDFPLISLTGGQDTNFILANLTLQGGSAGIYSSQDYGTQHMALQKMKFVVFRNQNYGIHLKKIKGFDNNFLENLGFVDCNIGFFQDPLMPWANDSDTSSFVDKTMFYKNQFINCGIAVSMRATRADNLNAWVDCKFDNNKTALNTSGQNFAIAANCNFTNNKGSAVTGTVGDYTYKENAVINGDLSYYSCNFSNNSAAFLINSKSTTMEGCNLLDNITVFANTIYYEENHNIINSTVNGRFGGATTKTHGVFINSSFASHPEYSKVLVNLKENVPTTIIDKNPTPYPQLLVTQ